MAHLLLENLEDDLAVKLAERAAKHRRSVEEEAREILRAEVEPGDPLSEPGLGTRIATIFAEANPEGLEFHTDDIRSSPPRAIRFN